MYLHLHLRRLSQYFLPVMVVILNLNGIFYMQTYYDVIFFNGVYLYAVSLYCRLLFALLNYIIIDKKNLTTKLFKRKLHQVETAWTWYLSTCLKILLKYLINNKYKALPIFAEFSIFLMYFAPNPFKILVILCRPNSLVLIGWFFFPATTLFFYSAALCSREMWRVGD